MAIVETESSQGYLPPNVKNNKTNNSSLRNLVDQDEVSYIESSDPYLINQYLDIRENAYQNRLGLKGFHGGYDEFDSKSRIILATKGDEVIGGMRLTIYDPVINTRLPMEEEGFILKDLLPELELGKNYYAECSRMAMKDEYRNGKHSAMIYGKSFDICRKVNVNRLFCIAPAIHGRQYKHIVKENFGLDIKVRRDICIPHKPVYKDIKSKIYLSTLVL